MTRTGKLGTAMAVALFIAVVVLVGVRTFSNSGEKAITAMEESERQVLKSLDAIRSGMTLEEVTSILGEPDEYGPLNLRPKWKVNGSPINAYVVYFDENGARQVRWLNIGQFIYERKL